MIGKMLAHYEITGALGKGGMGEVYRARDTKLGREVAVKVLPGEMSGDPGRVARFDREARSLASLQHGNIASIYGFETDAEVRFLVMELAEGEDLSERLKQGALPVEEVVELGQQLAEGLEAAHGVGIIHRDLKPANIKVSPDGRLKMLDFGLARAYAGDTGVESSLENSPTITSAMTQAGVILGTAAYMSPEQARGKRVDHRADIWAFGVVLFEMLTGRLVFEGDTVSDTLAGVLRADLPWDRLPGNTPPALRRLLKRCLARDPSRRLQAIAEARITLDDLKSGRAEEARPVAAAPANVRGGKERIAWIAIVVVLLAGLAAVTLWPGSTPQRPLVQSTLMPPEGWDFAPASPFAVSRDGRRVAFVANPRPGDDEVPVGSSGIWIRDLDSTEARRLADADGEAYPFWSPDGRWIGFYADGKLNKIEARGGPVIPVCDATDGRGGTWNETGTIVFQRAWSEGLMKVSAAGGTAEAVTTLDKDRFDIAHRWPHFLPDGRRFLFYLVSTTNPVASEHSGIYVGSLDSDEAEFLVKSESRALYSGGHLLYRAGSTLMARPFDASTPAFTGDPFPVATDVPGGAISWGGAQFGASEADVLVHLRGTQASLSVLTWRDRDGRILETTDDPGGYWEPALSHDGSRLAIAVGLDAADIWIYDLERDTRTRFTFDPADDRQPLWSPDDSRLVFSSAHEAEGEIYVRPTSGQGEAELLFTAGTNISLSDWSSDGRLIFFSYLELNDDSWDIWTLDIQTSRATPLLSGRFEQQMARLSPDGKWLASISDESGNSELYVQSFPEADGRWMVSSDGGARGAFRPVWRDDGREIYYERGGSVLAVPVTPGAGFSFGTPQTLFRVNIKSGQGAGLVFTDHGQRILSNELPPVDPAKSGARLIQNWSATLAAR